MTVLHAYYKLYTRCTSTIRRYNICKGTNCFWLLVFVVFFDDKNKTESLFQDFSLLCYFANWKNTSSMSKNTHLTGQLVYAQALKLVRPTFGVGHQLPEALSQKCTGLPLQPPTRTRSARVRCFSFFAFTSSPYNCKKLRNSDLRVNISPLFPSPVKAKKEHFLHPQYTLYQRIAGEGEGWRQEFRTRWVRDAQGRVRSRVRRCGWENSGWPVGEGTGVFSKRAGRKKKKEGAFRKKVHKFLFNLSLSSKNETFFSRNIRQFETNSLLLRLIKHNFPSFRRTAASI